MQRAFNFLVWSDAGLRGRFKRVLDRFHLNGKSIRRGFTPFLKADLDCLGGGRDFETQGEVVLILNLLEILVGTRRLGARPSDRDEFQGISTLREVSQAHD